MSNHDASISTAASTRRFRCRREAQFHAEKLTDYDGPDGGRLAWSPDSKWIAFERGDALKLWQYSEEKLGIVPSDGSAPARI